MKKYLTLSLILLFIAPMLAQAQTKQETVDWLNKYGQSILNSYYKDFTVVGSGDPVFSGHRYANLAHIYMQFEITNDGTITITSRGTYNSYDEIAYKSYSFSLEELDPSSLKILNTSFRIDCNSRSCIKVKKWGVGGWNREDSSIELLIGDPTSTRERLTKKFNSDPDVLRFHKALAHAIEIFGGKTVKKDLFDGN